MILEEKSQELRHRKWLEGRNDEDRNGSDNEQTKGIRLEEEHEVQIINKMWALLSDVKFKEDFDVFGFSAVADEGLRQNGISFPCYLCGPSTSGFSRART